MNNEQFYEKLEEILEQLESLSQHPQWVESCENARYEGNLTLGDAQQALIEAMDDDMWLVDDDTKF